MNWFHLNIFLAKQKHESGGHKKAVVHMKHDIIQKRKDAETLTAEASSHLSAAGAPKIWPKVWQLRPSL